MNIIIYNNTNIAIYLNDREHKVDPHKQNDVYSKTGNNTFHIMSKEGFIEVCLKHSKILNMISVGNLACHSVGDSEIYVRLDNTWNQSHPDDDWDD